MMNIDTKIALVSGANRGIGLAIATGLARQGMTVLLGCRDIDRGETACAPLKKEGLRIRPLPLDVTSDTSVSALGVLIGHAHGRLDILVNNAGIGLDHDPTLSPVDRLRKTLDVNVVGTMLLTEAMLPLLDKSAHPRIVNISSELASFALRNDPRWPYAGVAMPTYQASKAAVNALTLSYAAQLGGRGFKVNAVCPGYTATESTNFGGNRTPEQAAVIATKFAMLDDDGPNGSFANEDGELPW